VRAASLADAIARHAELVTDWRTAHLLSWLGRTAVGSRVSFRPAAIAAWLDLSADGLRRLENKLAAAHVIGIERRTRWRHELFVFQWGSRWAA